MLQNIKIFQLERVSDREMECESFLKRDVEIMVGACILRSMKTVTEVSADYEHPDVDTQTYACA